MKNTGERRDIRDPVRSPTIGINQIPLVEKRESMLKTVFEEMMAKRLF